MIKFNQFLEENPDLTVMGLMWAVIWRFWVAYFAFWIGIMFLMFLVA